MQSDERSNRRLQGGADKSLLARALGYLTRREHSRLQLRRRLAPYAESSEQIDRLLDRLQRENLLSDERFADAVTRRRSERFGASRVAQELKAHGIATDVQRPLLVGLRQTELARARAVWLRKFGGPATGAAERARQMRFLAQRGFAAEIVRRVVEGRGDD